MQFHGDHRLQIYLNSQFYNASPVAGETTIRKICSLRTTNLSFGDDDCDNCDEHDYGNEYDCDDVDNDEMQLVMITMTKRSVIIVVHYSATMLTHARSRLAASVTSTMPFIISILTVR